MRAGAVRVLRRGGAAERPGGLRGRAAARIQEAAGAEVRREQFLNLAAQVRLPGALAVEVRRTPDGIGDRDGAREETFVSHGRLQGTRVARTCEMRASNAPRI